MLIHCRSLSVVCVLCIVALAGASAQVVEEAEGLTAADAWINTVVSTFGSWGGSETATASSVVAIESRGTNLGYYVVVEPTGCILLSSMQELPPVYFYSTESRLEFGGYGGPGIFMMQQLEYAYPSLSHEAGAVDDIGGTIRLEHDKKMCREAWGRLLAGEALSRHGIGRSSGDYTQGGVLVDTRWHQMPPYNLNCPPMGCSYPNFPTYMDNALVGCVATAASQILAYWCWPPYDNLLGYQDWMQVFDIARWDAANNCFNDGHGVPIPQTSIDNVAILCGAVGWWLNADYGCDATSAYTCWWPGIDMLDLYEDQFYMDTDAECEVESSTLFGKVVGECDANRPIQYSSAGHSFVVDGYDYYSGMEMVHINYGWGPHSTTGWWTLQDLMDRDGVRLDKFIFELRPYNAQGAELDEGYHYPDTEEEGYEYYERSTTGVNVVYLGGWKIQFREGVSVRCIGQQVEYLSSDVYETTLYSRTINNSAISLRGGDLVLHREGTLRIN